MPRDLVQHPPSDVDELKRLMRAGDPAALDAFARRYGPRLIAVARRRCRLVDDAEDAVQNALLEARRSLSTYRGDGSPLAWLSALVAHGCARLNRDPRNDPARTLHDDGGAAADRPCAACESPDAVAARHELGEELGRALMALARLDRVIFLLAAEGASSDEIGAELALSSNAVRSRLKRSRKILRAQLGVTHGAAPAAPREHDPHDPRPAH